MKGCVLHPYRVQGFRDGHLSRPVWAGLWNSTPTGSSEHPVRVQVHSPARIAGGKVNKKYLHPVGVQHF